MPTHKHSVLAKIMIWYQNSTNFRATSMHVFLKTRNPIQPTLYQIPTNLMTGGIIATMNKVQH